MRKTFQTTQGICIAVFRLKYYGGFQFFHQTTLAGNTELGGEVCMDSGNHMHGKILCQESAPPVVLFL
jgi:hypothetical protein